VHQDEGFNNRAIRIEEIMAEKKSTVSKPRAKKETVTTIKQLRPSEPSLPEIESSTMQILTSHEKYSRQFFITLIATTALISSLITFGIANQFSPQLADRTTLSAQTSGGVCLTEGELKNVISENKIQAYWTGPLKDATYSINSATAGQVFIRYIPKGEECGSTAASFRVIATYAEADAFSATQQAGNQAEGVSLANTDGSVVYFNKNAPSNVYVAYPGIDYQIEIYDPNPKTAVTLATTSNQIQLIKD
jgi:hypothetical protein